MTKPQLQPGLPGRKEACPCGSQKKYKTCCGRRAKNTAPKPAVQPRPVRLEDFIAACNAAMEAFEAGKLKQAQASCEKALRLDPHHAEVLHLSAMIAEQLQNYEIALGYIQRALKQVPQASMFYNALGLIQRGLGQPEEAEKAYRMALQLDAENALAYHNLGDLWFTRKELAKADECYQEALRYKPDFPEAHGSLGRLRRQQHQYDEAIAHFAQTIALDPKDFNAYHNLAAVLREQNRNEQSQSVLEEVLRLKPDFAEAWHDLGVTLLALKQNVEGIAALEKSVAIKPELDLAYLNLSSHYYELGLVDVTLQYLRRAQAIRPSDATRLKMALCFPAVYDSVEQVSAEHERITAELAQLATEDLSIADPLEETAITPFFLAYRGENEVETLSRIGDVFLRACPTLGTVAPHCQTPKQHDGPLKIGFLSSGFARENHVVTRVMGPVIANWPRDRFAVTLLHRDFPSNEVRQYLREGDQTVRVPQMLDAAREQIAAAELDILFYCDLGMDPWSYFLSFARLAPLQLTSGGHPLTSGVPNIDYFFSSVIDEVAHAQEHYRERLILLPERSVCYHAATPLAQAKTRADLGLPENKRLYLCPMTPFKFHPEMDQLFGEILRTDPDSEIVLVTNYQTELWERLKQRFARTLPDVIERLRFLSFLSIPNFVELLRLGDVVIDTPRFGGGTTSLEALAVGTPVVTWPGELLRQRSTFAMYNSMNWFECVVSNANEYVRLATEIARRPDYRVHLKEEILARNAVLFGQTKWIQPYSELLWEMATKASA